MSKKIVIVGGGAAGFFAAIRAAELAKSQSRRIEISILEMSGEYLRKVRISGGGRCNVTHHIFEPRAFCENYPRGEKELLSAMQRFQSKDTVQWFADRGVRLYPEEDGRMFPTTNDSKTVIECFVQCCRELNVKILTGHSVQSIKKDPDGKFTISLREQEPLIADRVMIATGSSSGGYQLAKDLGHTITDLAPSLFSFKISDSLLTDLSGLSFENAATKLAIPDCRLFEESGPLLITHWGLSGPAILKLSAWAAREMKKSNYEAKLIVNWLGLQNFEAAKTLVKKLKEEHHKGQVGTLPMPGFAKRFWVSLLLKCNIESEKRWAEVSKQEIQTLANHIFATEFKVLGKNRFKDEFVECGGVSLKEIDFKTMESKICPGLYFAGEVLDIDGITGGFNFQAAWTGGFIAGSNMGWDQ